MVRAAGLEPAFSLFSLTFITSYVCWLLRLIAVTCKTKHSHKPITASIISALSCKQRQESLCGSVRRSGFVRNMCGETFWALSVRGEQTWKPPNIMQPRPAAASPHCFYSPGESKDSGRLCWRVLGDARAGSACAGNVIGGPLRRTARLGSVKKAGNYSVRLRGGRAAGPASPVPTMKPPSPGRLSPKLVNRPAHCYDQMPCPQRKPHRGLSRGVPREGARVAIYASAPIEGISSLAVSQGIIKHFTTKWSGA
jgi:hypothetical protein